MSRIRGKDTSPELIVRSLLHRLGYRFRLHKRIPIRAAPPRQEGRTSRAFEMRAAAPSNNPAIQKSTDPPAFVVRPDIILPKYKTAIFVHGCYWHRYRGCKNCTTPTHGRDNGSRSWKNSNSLSKKTCG